MLIFYLAKASTPCHFTTNGKGMSELQLIEAALKGAARRRRGERAWRGFWQGLLLGGLIWIPVQGLYKLFPLPGWSLTAAAVGAGALVFAGLIVGIWRKWSLLETATRG